MNYGINYGVAPNAGEGGVGRMLADDKEVYDYFNEVKGMPFLCGVQGEGRKWTATFSQEALGIFDYLFTDAMTIIDHKGRNSRIYRAEEALFDDITLEQYMDHLVDQTVLILTNEPADIYANPTFLPDTMAHDYDKYWTDGRIERVLDVLQQHGIALEINARYRIPSFEIIRRAKARGIKFTFGTNNEFGFDYLRDNMAISPKDLVQRPHNYAIVDEVDSVLIDDARTPLIISGPVPKGDDQLFEQLRPLVERLVEAQKVLATKYLSEAKRLIASNDKKEVEEGFLALYRSHKCLPKNKALIKFLSEQGIKAGMLKTEEIYMEQNNKSYDTK